MEKNDPYIQIQFDDSALRQVIEGVQDALRYQVKVGILSNDVHGGDGEPIGMADLGAIHEFGSVARGIPERSFIRRTMFQKRDEWLAKVNAKAESVMRGIKNKGLQHVFTKFAQEWKGYVLECFDSRGFGKWPPLAPSTIAGRKKGKDGERSDTPLQDTGRLIQSINYEVTKS